MMHGLEAYAASFKHVTRWLQDERADIRAIPIALYEGEESFDDLNSQVQGVMEYIRGEVRRDPGAFAEGYNLLCHSQGALICRAVVQDMDDHNVRTLVAMAGPQLGVFGAPAYWIRHLAGVGELAASNPSGLAYSKMLQDTFSVANMWNDPTMQDRFLRQNLFLPKYNGLTNDAAGNARRRQNLLRLDRAVFLGGSLPGRLGDDVIKPAASSVFGYFRVGSRTDVVPMMNQPFWAHDTLGLRALDKSGRLVVQVVPNARHRDWIWNEMLLRKYVFPHLV